MQGVDPRPELGEFYSLICAALTAGVRIVGHNVSFDVARFNKTALCWGVGRQCTLTSAPFLCTMHSATKHCGLRTRGDKRAKAPSNQELYVCLHKRDPPGPLHRALPDSQVTLSSYIKGKELRWW